ncbi:hypothetical protein [Clostridium tertium]|uniref:hypothetical protein n=1 Tax=Clostridium tertium TaxID=1559 RepID=UPI001AE7C45E|nr:hypothetical protein [Clostridium tertium]MBP1869016.1 hypothetical protein [Clostridium tertium]
MDINDSYLAFIFDEACEYILSMKTFKEIKEGDKMYKQECWIKDPKWIDIEEIKKTKSSNNSSLISEMEKSLEKYR